MLFQDIVREDLVLVPVRCVRKHLTVSKVLCYLLELNLLRRQAVRPYMAQRVSICRLRAAQTQAESDTYIPS